MEKKYKYYQGFYKGDTDNKDLLETGLSTAIQDLIATKEFDLCLKDCKKSNMQPSNIDQFDEVTDSSISMLDKYKRPKIFVLFDITIEANSTILIDQEFEFSILLKKRLYEFMTILSICRVSGFNLCTGVLNYDDDSFEELIDMDHYNIDLYQESLRKKWPTFINLNIGKTWSWYINEISETEIDKFSSIKKGINALSNSFWSSDNANKLFWTMVGIESIYVEGKNDISSQIKIKAQKFLGVIDEFKRRLNHMYSFRSKFIHGEMNIPFHFEEKLNNPLCDFEKDLENSLEIAESVLIATIQKMISESRKELMFDYKLSESKEY